jgi:hypothetical protein
MSDKVVLIQEEPRGPSQLIELPVTVNGVARVQFPDIQQLRSDQTQQIVIKKMRLITLDVLTNGIISGLANAPVTELQKISVVLYSEGWEKGQLIPVLTMNDMTFAGSVFPHNYQAGMPFDNWKSVDWSKSYLQWATGTVSAGASYVVMFDVTYTRYKANTVNGQIVYTEIVGPN